MADRHGGEKSQIPATETPGSVDNVPAAAGDGGVANPLEMEWWLTKAQELLGDWGLAILFVVVAVFTVWWQWDKIRKLPGIGQLLAAFSRKPFPAADKERFTVGVAHLEKDQDGEVEGLVVKALRELEGVQVVRFDRTISVEGSVPEESERAGHEQARAYLEKAGADVLIWGRIWRHEGKSLPQLYWTSSHAGERKPGDYRPTEDLKMPPVFWDDLADVLGLLAVSRYADLYGEGGHYVADRLAPFIAKVRRLLAASAGKSEWNADALASTQVVLADALRVLGEQTGENAPLEEAVRRIGRRWRNGPASGCRWSGRRPRTTWAPRFGGWGSVRAGRGVWRRRLRRIGRRWRNGPGSGCRCTGRRPRTTWASRF